MNKPANGKLIKMLLALPVLGMLTGAVTLRDPTRPPHFITPADASTPSSGHEGNTLSAIFNNPDHKVAIINNQIVRVGDRIGEFTITTITPYTVELTGPDDSKQVLELISPVKEIKK